MTLKKVALPIALQSLIGSSLSLVDNLMVGSLGETELAAVGVGIQPFFIFWMVVFGFTSGCATFMAQFWGTKDVSNIKKMLGFAMTICAGVGLCFFVICMFFPGYIVNIFTNIDDLKQLSTDYIRIGAPCYLFLCFTVPITFCLRTTQQTKIPLYTSSFAFCMNTFFNYVLIFGKFGAPALGVSGAAMATIIARFLELALVLFIVFYKKNIISGKISEYFGWTKEFAVRVVKNAIPTTLNETLWGAGYSLYTAAYARVGVTQYAAIQLGRVIENLFIMAAFSIGDAALILIGQRLGAGELDYGYALGKKMLKIAAVVGVVAGILLIVVAKPVISLFNFTPEGTMYTFYILIVYGSVMGIIVVNATNIVGVLRAGGDTRFAMAADCLCIWLIGLPTVFFVTQKLSIPIYFVVLLVQLEEVIKLFILLARFKSKKWVRNVISDI